MTSVYMAYGLCFILASTSIVMIWYCKQLIVKYQEMVDDISELRDNALIYAEHLKTVYELESYYGDPTLTNLLKHTRHIEGVLKDFEIFNALPFDENSEITYDRNQDKEEETQKNY